MGARYLKPKEACKILNISFITLYNWRRKGKIKAIKTKTGRHLYPESEVMRLLQERNPKAYVKRWIDENKERLLNIYQKARTDKKAAEELSKTINRIKKLAGDDGVHYLYYIFRKYKHVSEDAQNRTSGIPTPSSQVP